ncbi:hypothetical protein Tco_1427502 [Tanacetum coccineum]
MSSQYLELLDHDVTPPPIFRCDPILGGYRFVMSSASSAVSYTSVYTDSEPGRVFWGADEEISDGGVP